MAEFLILPSTSPSQENETESFKWGHNTTLMFLDLYKAYRKQVGTLKIRNLKKMFDEIAKELQYKTNQNISAANCENRWKHLERMYKRYIDNNNKTSRGRKDFEYADIMETILGKKRNIRPVLLLSSETVTPLNVEDDTSNLIDIDTTTQNESIMNPTDREKKIEITRMTATPSGRFTKTAQSGRFTHKNKKLRLDVLKEIREDRKEFYKRMLDIEEKILQAIQRKNEILIQKNTILKQATLKESPLADIL